MAGREGAFLGHYRLVRRLGGGATGEVYLAEGQAPPASAPERVVVKVLNGAADDPTAREIVRQAEIAARLREPHIVPLFGLARDAAGIGVVMAHAPGGSLGQTLAPDAANSVELPLPVGVAARIVSQLARALVAAHQAGIVHGDLKPQNVFVRTAPNGKPLAALGDFGQGGVVMAAAARLTHAATEPAAEQVAWVAAQLRYAAPEQLRGVTIPASDQYALATLAYELLTGRHPLAGQGMAFLGNLAQANVVAPSRFNPELSPEVDAVLLRALARQPEVRYPTIGAFADALDAALAVGAVSGVTRQMAALTAGDAGGDAGDARARRTPHAVASSGGAVLEMASRSAPVSRGLGVPLPASDAPSRVRKRLAVATAVAVLFAMLACTLSVFALNRSGRVSTPPPVAQSTSASTSAPSSPAKSLVSAAVALQAEAKLASVTSQAPVYSDSLASASARWPANGKSIFFGSDARLHLYNSSADHTVTVDNPTTSVGHALAARVTLAFVKGYTSDLAGLRFFVHANDDGTQTAYSYLISPDGHFEVWYASPGGGDTPDFLLGGYSSALKTGMGVTNSLAVLADGQHHLAWVYANGHCIAQVALEQGTPQSGTAGLTVMDGGEEAAFAQYAVYHG